jgi:hypothetical protein
MIRRLTSGIIALALGLAACQHGHRARFTTAAALVSELIPEAQRRTPAIFALSDAFKKAERGCHRITPGFPMAERRAVEMHRPALSIGTIRTDR